MRSRSPVYSRRAVLIAVAAGILAGCGGSPTTGRPTVAAVPSVGPGTLRVSYGDDESQFGDLYLPASTGSAIPVIVLIHGGGWVVGATLHEFDPYAAELVGNGVAVWNIEYRVVGNGGGWPMTFQDVAAAVDAVAGPVQQASGYRLDTGRVRAIGYSAGGHLALWLAGRPQLPDDAPGANPVVMINAVAGLAPVTDLVAAATTGTSTNVHDLMGGSPAEQPERYEFGSPIRKLPVRIPVICVHGDSDATVPVAQSESYVAAAATVGDPAQLLVVPGADHGAITDITGPGWEFVRDQILSGI